MIVRVRRLSRLLGACWLVGQIAMLSTAAVVLTTVPAGRAAFISDRCECQTGGGVQICPMHHRAAGAPLSSGQCALRQCPPHDAVLLTVVSGVGVLAQVPVLHQTPAASPLFPISIRPTDRTVIPDPPPPRT